jgi:hypothetical protein
MKKRYEMQTESASRETWDKKKVALFIILLIVIFAVPVYLVLFPITAPEPAPYGDVLAALEDQYISCSSVISSIATANGTEVFAICNNRPFLARYEDNTLYTTYNGWSFLQQDTNLWSELQDCEFYKTVGSDLYFYCIEDWKNVDYKIYTYNTIGQMTKKSEGNFETVLDQDVKSVYSLSGCALSNLSIMNSESWAPEFLLDYTCDGKVFRVVTDMVSRPILPPVSLETDTCENNALNSASRFSLDCEVGDVSCEGSGIVSLSCNDVDISLIYNFASAQVSYSISYDEASEIPTILGEVAKYFILPPVDDTGELELVESGYNLFNYSYYQSDDIVLSIGLSEDSINNIWTKTERMVYHG